MLEFVKKYNETDTELLWRVFPYKQDWLTEKHFGYEENNYDLMPNQKHIKYKQMKFKLIKKILVIVFCINGTFVYPQDAKPRIFDRLTANIGFKETLITSSSKQQSQILDFYLGYKFKNKFSVGVCTGSNYQLSYSNNSFEYFTLMGIGMKYLLFELDKNRGKGIGFEPYVFLTRAVGPADDLENYFTYYDIGINFIVPEMPYFYGGTGIMQNFYNLEKKNLFCWYISFGLRI
jgi:hypothetical protein